MVAVIVLMVATPNTHAQPACTKFASLGGSDKAAGTSAAPFRSAQKLVNSLSAGDVGCLRTGTYVQGALTFPRAGASGAPITLTSYPGERAKLAGGTVSVPNGSDFVTISNVDIDGSAALSDVSVQVMAADTVLEGDDITNRSLASSCLILGSFEGFGEAVRTVIRANLFHDCGSPLNGAHDHAVYAENSDGASIVDNVIWNSAAWGIQFYPYARRSMVAHNVIDGNAGGLVFASEAGGGEYDRDYASSDNTVEYNVISNSTQTYNIAASWDGPVGTGNVARGNCVWNGHQGDISSDDGFATIGNVVADPKYVSRPTADFRLGSDSECLSVVGYDTAAKLGVIPIGGGGPPSRATSPARAGNAAPRIRIVSPADGSTARRTFRVVARATDDHGVKKVAFRLGASLLATDRRAPYTASLTAHRAGRLGRWHTVLVKAYDRAGRVSSASAHVYVTSRGGVRAARRCARTLRTARAPRHRGAMRRCVRRILSR
jgi:hypothetical protein